MPRKLDDSALLDSRNRFSTRVFTVYGISGIFGWDNAFPTTDPTAVRKTYRCSRRTINSNTPSRSIFECALSGEYRRNRCNETTTAERTRPFPFHSIRFTLNRLNFPTFFVSDNRHREYSNALFTLASRRKDKFWEEFGKKVVPTDVSINPFAAITVFNEMPRIVRFFDNKNHEKKKKKNAKSFQRSFRKLPK